MGKPRMVRSDKWKKRPATSRYWAFKDMIVIAAKKQKFELGDCFNAVFYIQMPESWSKKKKALLIGCPHQQKPDVDNLCKGLMDSLLKDDSGVWRIEVEKFWWKENKIIVKNLVP